MLTSDVTRLQTQINTLLIVCVLVLAGVLIWVTNVLTRPIVALSEKMLSYQMEEGVTGLDFTRKDEVGRLNRAFRQMSDTIRSLFEKQKTESEAREKYQYEALRAPGQSAFPVQYAQCNPLDGDHPKGRQYRRVY